MDAQKGSLPFRDEFDAGCFHWALQYEYTPAEYRRRALRYRWNYKFLLNLDKSARILEIGCGGGFFLHFLKAHGFFDCTGVDLDPAAVRACRANVTRQVFCEDPIQFLERSPAPFDLIVSNHVIEHLPRLEVLRLLHRVRHALAPGGQVCVTTPNAMSPWASFHLYNDPTHCHLYTPATLEELLLEAGYTEIELSGEGPAPYDSLTAARFALWKVRRAWLGLTFAIDVGVGRHRRVKRIFEQGIIGRAKGGRVG